MTNENTPNLRIYNLVSSEPFEINGDSREIKYESFVFQGGEVHIKIKDNPKNENIRISCRINNSDDLMRLVLAVDALRRMHVKYIEVFIPYIPYARQDRVMVQGEPLSIKVFAGIVNSMQLDKIICYDLHSDVSAGLIDNIEYHNNHSFVKDVLKDKSNYLIVSPDAGSYKKIFSLCQYLNYKNEIILCNKVRDVKSGKIQNISVSSNDLNGMDVYIVDDICSKGGTFLLLAEKLKQKKCGDIYLIVSHYEGCADENKFKDAGFKRIYKTNSISEIESDFIDNFHIYN